MKVVLTRLEDGTGALLDLGTMEYFGLNATAVRIWELLDAELPPEEVGRRLAAEFEIDEADASEAVRAFLADLSQAGLR